MRKGVTAIQDTYSPYRPTEGNPYISGRIGIEHLPLASVVLKVLQENAT